METKTRFSVDAAHCQRAADELYEMLLRQDLAFGKRWDSSRLTKAVLNTARVAGISVSLLGVGLTLTLAIMGAPAWCAPPRLWYLPLYVLFLVFFSFLPRILSIFQRRVRRFRERSCRRHAERLVRAARKLAPFEADYELKGDLLVYTRGKEGRWQLAWHRNLDKHRQRGVAIQGVNVTAIFRRPTSFYPSIVILKDSTDWLARVLQEAGLTVQELERPPSAHEPAHGPPDEQSQLE